MKENPGVRVVFENGKAKVTPSKGEKYTNIALESSYADFEAFMIKRKK